MNYIILDFEVFKQDVLLGALVVDETPDPICIQTWDPETMIEFYKAHSKDMWIGHNNIGYDNVILETIIKGRNPYKISKEIVSGNKQKCHLPIYTYDTMKGFYSLKATEMVVGKNISETPVDFDIDRALTADEKKRVESYNRDDLNQTYENFIAQFDEFALRLDIIKEFDLPMKALNISEARLAATVLGAKKIEGIEDMVVDIKLPPNLQLKNEKLKEFYLNEDFKKGKTIKFDLCGCEQTVARGGIHGALKKVQIERALYFDVSGYYNLIMLNYDLLPRTMPEESRKLYDFMYHEQLRLKKINPRKRMIYKIILLAVFGGMLNKYTDFYDPCRGCLVTITGELFLVDLLEKLEGTGICVQSNTDGIVFKPNNWEEKEKIIKIVEEIVDYLLYDILPEETVEQHKLDLLLFQYACKAMSFDYCCYEVTTKDGVVKEKLQNVNRAFASNDSENLGTVIKYKTEEGKTKKARIQSLPPNVFIYNQDIRSESVKKELAKKIDYGYYIKRIYERCGEFIEQGN